MEIEIAKFRGYGKMKSFGVTYKKICAHYDNVIKAAMQKVEPKDFISFLENFEVETIGRVIPALYSQLPPVVKFDRGCKNSLKDLYLEKIPVLKHFTEKYGVIGDPVLCRYLFKHFHHTDFKFAKWCWKFSRFDQMGKMEPILYRRQTYFDLWICDEPNVYLVDKRLDTIKIFHWKLNNFNLSTADLDYIENDLESSFMPRNEDFWAKMKLIKKVRDERKKKPRKN